MWAEYMPPNVVRNLLHVVQRNAGDAFHFKQQKVGEAGLGPFDLRRQHGFLADVGIQEKFGIGQTGGQTIQPAQGKHRPFDELMNLLEVFS